MRAIGRRNPDVPCQYQMNEPTGLVEAILLPK
jgi:hypothetical protein